MKTAVVILNWNTKGYLEQFLPALLNSTKDADAEVIVADSASTDGSMEMMAEKFPTVRVIKLDKNYGFTGGYNRALAQIEAEYFVLINSDIEVSEHWLEPLVERMDADSTIGACGPKLLSWYKRDTFEYAGAAGGFLDRYGYPFCRGRMLKMVEKDNGQYDTPANVFWATGACLMVRSELFNKLGGLDDRFFAHMEEIDLCWRIQLEGYSIEVIPQSVVYHLGGGTLPNDSPWKLKLNFRNNLLLLDNNLAKTYALEAATLEPASEDTPAKKMSTREEDEALAEAAKKKAERLIWFRMVLDGLSAAIYLCTFKKEYFDSVKEAHKEYKQLHIDIPATEIATFLETRRQKMSGTHRQAIAVGMYRHWMVPRAMLMKHGVFRLIHEIKSTI
jgi:GT2 family glycosyltransferase